MATDWLRQVPPRTREAEWRPTTVRGGLTTDERARMKQPECELKERYRRRPARRSAGGNPPTGQSGLSTFQTDEPVLVVYSRPGRSPALGGERIRASELVRELVGAHDLHREPIAAIRQPDPNGFKPMRLSYSSCLLTISAICC